MPNTIALAADSTTVVLYGFLVDDLVDGDYVLMTPANPATAQTRGLNSVNVQRRSDGLVYDITIRVPKYSATDEQFNSWISTSIPTILNGSIKENYEKDGTARVCTYSIEGASFTTLPTDTRNNQDGNNMMEYIIRANTTVRSL